MQQGTSLTTTAPTTEATPTLTTQQATQQATLRATLLGPMLTPRGMKQRQQQEPRKLLPASQLQQPMVQGRQQQQLVQLWRVWLLEEHPRLPVLA